MESIVIPYITGDVPYIYIIHNCIYILYIIIIIYSWGYDPFTTWDAPPGNLTKVDGDLDKGIN